MSCELQWSWKRSRILLRNLASFGLTSALRLLREETLPPLKEACPIGSFLPKFKLGFVLMPSSPAFWSYREQVCYIQLVDSFWRHLGEERAQDDVFWRCSLFFPLGCRVSLIWAQHMALWSPTGTLRWTSPCISSWLQPLFRGEAESQPFEIDQAEK